MYIERMTEYLKEILYIYQRHLTFSYTFSFQVKDPTVFNFNTQTFWVCCAEKNK